MQVHMLPLLGLVLGLWGTPDWPTHALQDRCRASTTHPLEIRVRLQDDLEPERWMTARISVESRVDLPSAVIMLDPTRGAEIQGPRRLELGALEAASPQSWEVLVRVPDQREPAQVFATLEGEGPHGTLRRGAALHMLPRGPLHPREIVPHADKRDEVHRYPGVLRRVK